MGQLISAERDDDNPQGRISVRVLENDERIWVKPANTRPVEYHHDMPHGETEIIYSEHTLKNLQEVGLGVPVLLEVQPIAGAEAGMCHSNVQDALQEGDEHVMGYEMTVSLNCCGCINFALHSVIRRNGKLLDVSPDPWGETVKYFVEDSVIEYAGKRPPRSPDSVLYCGGPTCDLILPFILTVRTDKHGILHCGSKSCIPSPITNPYYANETHYYKLRSEYIAENRS
tara:strand:- start:165 stop:848 length:684 start_codon:yes stop_codon:yes gene_type:complete